MLFASIGNISTELVKKKVEKWFSKQDIKLKNASQIKIQNPENQAIHTHILQREVSQTHVIMGQKSYPLDHTLRPAMFLFNNMLGGPAMNSILNMAIRERKGIRIPSSRTMPAIQIPACFTFISEAKIRLLKNAKHWLLRN
jgi:predicted Zn-dependent peptidase